MPLIFTTITNFVSVLEDRIIGHPVIVIEANKEVLTFKIRWNDPERWGYIYRISLEEIKEGHDKEVLILQDVVDKASNEIVFKKDGFPTAKGDWPF